MIGPNGASGPHLALPCAESRCLGAHTLLENIQPIKLHMREARGRFLEEIWIVNLSQSGPFFSLYIADYGLT